MLDEPRIEYSWSVYAIVIAAFLTSGALLAVGMLSGTLLHIIGGVVFFLAAVGLTRLARHKLHGEPALARESGMLVGGALREPLPLAGTTFEVKSDNDGSWVVVLFPADGLRIVLAPGGWMFAGRPVRRRSAEAALRSLGLSPRDPS